MAAGTALIGSLTGIFSFPFAANITEKMVKIATSRWANLSQKNKNICSGIAAVATATIILTIIPSTNNHNYACFKFGFQTVGVIYSFMAGSCVADSSVLVGNNRMILSVSAGAISSLFGSVMINAAFGGLLGAGVSYSVAVIGAPPLPAAPDPIALFPTIPREKAVVSSVKEEKKNLSSQRILL